MEGEKNQIRFVECRRRRSRVSHYRIIMKTRSTEQTRYKINEFYRKQLFDAVINRDPATGSWSWKGHIDFEDGPYSEFTSRRSFATGLEAEDHMRRFVWQRIDSWFSATQPGRL